MKSKNILACAILLALLYSCATTRPTPLYNEKCPFRRLNFTAGNEKDTLLNTLSINDTLIAALKADLSDLKKTGSVGNNLNLAIRRVNGMARTASLDVTNEYYQLFNNKTTAICGLNDLLKNNRRLRSPENRSKAEELLLKLVQDLSDFSDKKKLEKSTTN